MKRLPFLFLALLLASCNQQKVAHASYHCANDAVFKVEFSNGEKAILTIDDNPTTLIRVDSSTGAKYENEGVILETMGVDATYTPRKNAKPINCKRD